MLVTGTLLSNVRKKKSRQTCDHNTKALCMPACLKKKLAAELYTWLRPLSLLSVHADAVAEVRCFGR